MHRWKFSALATAAILSAGLFSTDASALALGRVNVQSALGEPLRAEIELPQITAAEAESLRVSTARPETFRAQGLEYSPMIGNVQVQLHRRADGSMVLRLSSARPINEPFVDMVIDATWSSGHIMRSYTMLFDPPAPNRAPAAVTVAPQVTAPQPEAAQVAPPPKAAQAAPRASAPAAAPAAAPTRAAMPRPAAQTANAPSRPPVAKAAGADGESVRVRPGDTAGRIADAHRPASVSLDQMLVAMAQANPKAFIDGNVNRLRSGSVLQMPSEADAQATPAAEARQIVAAQSRDFNEFRRRMAGAAPAAQVAAAQRSASGTVQAQVDESKPAAASPDKLTLSKGGVQASKADEQLARDKQADQNTARLAELSKNIAELNQLNGASTGAAAAAASTNPPGIAVPTPTGLPQAATEPKPSTEPQTADSAPAPAPQAPEAAAPAPSPAPAAAAAPKPAVPPSPQAEPGFIDSLMEDPLQTGGALALVLALLGYGGYRVAQSRRNQGAVDSSFLDNGSPPDSFFGASGGRRVDTTDSRLSTGTSSMSYSPSQLDVGGDVDPVAEADVYLAYGRDLQAEEILKEAMQHNSERLQIPAKLAEIYAKRQDHKALESAASEVFRLTGGQGADWARVADLGRALDPDNALYQPGGQPAKPTGVEPDTAPATMPPGTMTAASAISPAFATSTGPDSVLPDLDLDLDLDLHEAPPAPPPAPSAFAMAAAANEQAAAAAARPAASTEPVPTLDLDDLEDLVSLGDLEPAPQAEPEPETDKEAPLSTEPTPLDFEADGLSLMDSAAVPLADSEVKDSAPAPLEFDLGDLSLDLSLPAEPSALAQTDADAAAETLPDDPLATKLALAEEFNTIGDSEGARTLVEEVIAEATGDLKARAKRLLAEIG